MLPLSSPNDGGQDLNSRTLGEAEDLIHDLLYRLLSNGLSAVRTMGPAHPGEKEAQIVVNLRYRSHGGTGITTGRFLINGNGR